MVEKGILVVDNNPVFLDFMTELLGKEGYKIKTAEDGLKALQILKMWNPQFIFIDLIMPQISGEELCRIIHSRFKSNFAKIIIVSAIAAEEARRNFKDIADAYLAKMPFKKMRSYIIRILNDLEKGNIQKYKGKIIGIEEVYRREITKELLVSKNHLNALLKSMAEGFVELTHDFKIIYANPAALIFFGTSEEELLGTDFLSYFDEQYQRAIQKLFKAEDKYPESLGEDFPVLLKGRQILIRRVLVDNDMYQSVGIIIHDITERKKAEETIKRALKEKEILLQEIHHRIKNNLAMILNLINLQGMYIKEKKVHDILTELENKINSIFLIHEKLYKGEDIVTVDFDEYISDLVANITRSSTLPNMNITTEIDIAPGRLNVNRVIPLGLIVTELVTNAFKYAFHKKRRGKIWVTFKKKEDRYRLVVGNNGTSFPEEINFREADSLGFRLVCSLTEQLNGKIELNREEGTEFTIDIPL